MNCQELSQDIKRLKSLRNSLKEKVDSATETGFGRIAVESVKKDITSATDQILEKYVNDFYEKNPKLLHVTLGKRIDGFADANGNPAWVSSIAPIPGTDNLLIGGILGALYEYQKQQDGSYKLGERIRGFKSVYDTISIYSIARIPGTDNLLIGGDDGVLYEYQKQQDGAYKLGKRIDGFENMNGSPARVTSIAHIPGTDNLLIGGHFGVLYEYQKQPNGPYKLGKMIDGFEDSDGRRTHINSIARIPGTDNLLIGGNDGVLYEYQKKQDGAYKLGKRTKWFTGAYSSHPASIRSIAHIPGTDNLLIAGDFGSLYEYQKQQDGSYKLGKRIDGFKHANGNTTSIYSIVHIPGTDNLLIGGADGALYECQKQQNESYKLGKMIDGFEDSDGYPTSIYSIVHIPGTDNLLIGGGGGALYEACVNLPSLSNLKRSLPQIINKNIQQDV